MVILQQAVIYMRSNQGHWSVGVMALQLEATDLSTYQSCCLQTAAGEAFHEAEQSDVLMYFLGGANVLK